MSENRISVLPDVIEPIANAIHQNLPETEKQTDGALSTLVGFFNQVVLYPIKKANLTFKYKLEAFEDDIKVKISSIPEEDLQVPPISIAGPTLEALRYTYDEENLREMYENLLATAMDAKKESQVLPSFVDAIRQMSSLDAQIMQVLAKYVQLRCAVIKFVIKDSFQLYRDGMPDYFVEELLEFGDPFVISASLKNLERLGIIDIWPKGLQNNDYEVLREHPYVVERFEKFKTFGKEIEIDLQENAIQLNDYGKCFVNSCIRGVSNAD